MWTLHIILLVIVLWPFLQRLLAAAGRVRLRRPRVCALGPRPTWSWADFREGMLIFGGLCALSLVCGLIVWVFP